MNEASVEKILEAIPWRCFQCDFITIDRAEAAAHFGERDDAEEFKPICRWWNNMDKGEQVEALQDTIKQLNAERDDTLRLRMRIEDLEYQTEGHIHAINSYKPFREAKCRSIYDLFCLYDSMEGRALAAEAQLRDMREALRIASVFVPHNHQFSGDITVGCPKCDADRLSRKEDKAQ